MTSSTRRQTT